MKGIDAALKIFKEFITKNQHGGVSEQVVSLSIAIAEASARLDKSTFSLYKKQSSIGDKDF